MLEVGRQSSVCGRLIGIDRRARRGVLAHEALKGGAGRVGNDLGPDLVRGAILYACNGGLAHRAPARVRKLFPLRLGHVRPTPAHVGLIRFHGTAEGLFQAAPRLADAVKHEPSRLLCHANIPMQLHAGHAFQARHFEIDGETPLAHRDPRPLQRRPDLD